MNWKLLKERFSLVGRGSTASFTLPSVILEIQGDFVAAARLEGSGRSPRRLGRIGVFEFKSRCLEPSGNQPNILNDGELRQALRQVVELIGDGNSRYGLVIPDAAVRVGVLEFESLPDSRAEAEALVRWRMKEILPFAPDEARLSYQALGHEPGRIEVLALAAKKSVLAEYESALDLINGGAVLVLPATVALLPLLRDEDGAGRLLVHVCSGWITSAVMAGGRLRLWRTRAVGRPAPEDLVREVASEAARVLASCRDHLKVDVERVQFCVRPSSALELVSQVGSVLSRHVDLLASTPELGAMLPSEEKILFEQLGATIAGVVANAD